MSRQKNRIYKMAKELNLEIETLEWYPVTRCWELITVKGYISTGDNVDMLVEDMKLLAYRLKRGKRCP